MTCKPWRVWSERAVQVRPPDMSPPANRQEPSRLRQCGLLLPAVKDVIHAGGCLSPHCALPRNVCKAVRLFIWAASPINSTLRTLGICSAAVLCCL